jgi:hypothetical protein
MHDQFVTFPKRLSALCALIGDLIGPTYSIKPDAAIVNFYPVMIYFLILKDFFLPTRFSDVLILTVLLIGFYQEGSVMGGHVDDAELTYSHPVISISIGCQCLFLLGRAILKLVV